MADTRTAIRATPRPAGRAHVPRVLVVGPTPPPEGGMAAQAATLVAMLRSENVDAHHVSTSPSLGLLASLERVPGVRLALRTARLWTALARTIPGADVVHVLGASRLYFGLCAAPAVVLGRLCRKRVVLNYRGGAAREFFAAWPRLVRHVAGLADAVIVPSTFLVDVFAGLRIQARIVPNIIDLAAFPFRRRLALEPRLLVTRNLELLYDVETAILALAYVRQLHPTASLTCVGSGSLRRDLEARAHGLGLTDVRFAGSVPHARMGEIYDAADIFVNPSTIDNSPNSILESFAAGLPVISTDVGGIRRLVIDGENGLLVPPRAPKAIADAVTRLLVEPDLVAQLVAGGRRTVQRFAWPHVRPALYRAYGWPHEPIHA